MKAAVYARVSTFDQEPENQLAELRRYAQARGWTIAEHVDRGISGARTAGRHSTKFWQTQGAGASTYWSCGASTDLDVACAIS